MRNSEKVKKAIDDGLEGKNRGISMGSTKLDALIGGITKGRYDLIGGTTSSSKTAFADNFYVLKPWFKLRELREEGKTEKTLKVFYYSLEIDEESKLAKWLGWIIFQKFRILLDIETILTLMADDGVLQKNRMSKETYDLLMGHMHLLDELGEDVFIIDNTKTSPSMIYRDTCAYAERTGKMETIPVCDKDNNFLYNKNIYIPNNPNETVLTIVDHIGLIKPNKEGGTKKSTIDLLSGEFVTLRNRYKYNFLAVSQFNRELADTNRQRFRELTPQLEDFKETGCTQEDANVVMSIFNPVVYNMQEYKKYKISRLGPKARFVSILKNRNKSCPHSFAFHFEGAVGAYRDLPVAEEMTKAEYDKVSATWPTEAPKQTIIDK